MISVATVKALRGLAIVVAAFAMLVVYVANPLAADRLPGLDREPRGEAPAIARPEQAITNLAEAEQLLATLK